MAFTVKLWAFTKAPNSTAQPSTTGTSYNCVSNGDFNIIEPRIPLQIGAATNPTAYNYMQISSFSRYYWIQRWSWESGLWVAYCRVDALASWKTEIGSLSAYVLRSAAAYDTHIIDNMWPRKTTATYKVDTAATSWWNDNPLNGSFVVGIAGSGATTYYWFTYSMLDAFLYYLSSDEYADAAVGVFMATVNPDLKVQLRPLQYLTSIIWIPYNMYDATNPPTAASTLYVGHVNVIGKTSIGQLSPVSAYILGSSDAVLTFNRQWATLYGHPDSLTIGSWANAGLSEYQINISPFGCISLDPVRFANSSQINTMIQVDTRTGYATLHIWGGTTTDPQRDLFCRLTGQVGLPYQIGQVMAPGSGMASLIPTIIAGAGAVAAGIATGGAAGAAMAAGGIANAGMSAIGTIGEHRITSSNTLGGPPNVAALRGKDAIYYTWWQIGDMDVADKGRPLCEKRTLSTLSGYQLCADVEVQIPCTRDEEQMIKGFLESGYFYE